MGLGSLIARPWGAAATTLSNPVTNGTQYEGQTSLVVPGTGFTALSVISIDGTAYSTTYNSPTQVTVTVPAAEVAGSPLRTSGAKTLTVNTGPLASATWTVDAWSAQANLTSRKRVFVCTSADCNGVTVDSTKFVPWTDRLGNGDMVGHPTAGSATLKFRTNIFPGVGGLPGVEAGSPGNSVGQISSTGSVGSDFLILISTVTIIDANVRRCFRYSGSAGSLTLQTKGSNNATAQVVYIPTLGTPLTLERPLTHVERVVFSIGWSSTLGAIFRKNLEGSPATGGVNPVTAAGSTMIYGVPAADSIFGDWWTGNIVTCDGMPSATERDRAVRELMIRISLV